MGCSSIMLFNSYIFILFFFPVCLLGYFGLNRLGIFTLAQAFLFGMSLWFYGYFNPGYLPIILGSIVLNYAVTWVMGKTENRKLKKAELTAALLLNIGILFYFKYLDFFTENINALLGTDFAMRNILLPLGISFFTFQQVSYVVDAYRGEVQQYNFLQYASFVVYFPQLSAGPIVTHDELIPQFNDPQKKHLQWDNFAAGLYIFVLGLAKKVLIADTFGSAANWGFANITQLDSTNAMITMLAYTIQIYFDFGGYCDMAIGIGRMMNIDLPVNFDSPYKATTITEFWARWHKTLTRFFTKYVYIPLGGNRKGNLRTYLNVFIVFLISGLWHGANWTFILWGCLHGVFMVITRRWKGWFEKMPKALGWLITFSFVNVAWVFFRADSIADGMTLLSRITELNFGPINGYIASAFHLPEFLFVMNLVMPLDAATGAPNLLLIAAFLGVMPLLFARNAYERMQTFRPRCTNLAWIWFLLIWCILSFSGVSTFLYFNF